MKMNEKEFVSYETAKKLKEAGFVQEWDNGGNKFLYVAHDKICRISDVGCYNYVDNPKDAWDIPTENYPCVTLWQALMWIIDKGFFIEISIMYNGFHSLVVEFNKKRTKNHDVNGVDTPCCNVYYKTYNAALAAGIDDALELITNKTE